MLVAPFVAAYAILLASGSLSEGALLALLFPFAVAEVLFAAAVAGGSLQRARAARTSSSRLAFSLLTVLAAAIGLFVTCCFLVIAFLLALLGRVPSGGDFSC